MKSHANKKRKMITPIETDYSLTDYSLDEDISSPKNKPSASFFPKGLNSSTYELIIKEIKPPISESSVEDPEELQKILGQQTAAHWMGDADSIFSRNISLFGNSPPPSSFIDVDKAQCKDDNFVRKYYK